MKLLLAAEDIPYSASIGPCLSDHQSAKSRRRAARFALARRTAPRNRFQATTTSPCSRRTRCRSTPLSDCRDGCPMPDIMWPEELAPDRVYEFGRRLGDAAACLASRDGAASRLLRAGA